MLILSHRFARWCRVRSLRGFAADDWMMITAVPLFYTGLIVCLNIIATGGGSNLFPPEQFSTFTQKEIDEILRILEKPEVGSRVSDLISSLGGLDNLKVSGFEDQL